MWLYADDMVILSERRELLQAISKLQEWSQENYIINRNKTKVMKFRKGGTMKNRHIHPWEIVKSYLGIMLQVTVHAFYKHIEDR